MTTLETNPDWTLREVLWRSVVSERGVRTPALEETLAQYRDDEMTWERFHHLAVRLSGNLGRLARSLPVARSLPHERLSEPCWVRVSGLCPVNQPERPGGLDFLVLTGRLAGLVVPGLDGPRRGGIRAMSAVRALMGRSKCVPTLSDLLGAEFQAQAMAADGQAWICNANLNCETARREALERYRYRYERGIRGLEPCGRHRSCVSCGVPCERGQLAGPSLPPCRHALRSVGLERTGHGHDGGAVSGVSDQHGAGAPAGQ